MSNIPLNIRIREACLALSWGWNVGDGARRAGMSSQQWATYRRRGSYPPKPQTQLRITEALRLPPGALLWSAAEVLAYPVDAQDDA